MHLSEIELFLQGREFVVYCAEAVQIKTIISQQRSDTGLLDEIKYKLKQNFTITQVIIN